MQAIIRCGDGRFYCSPIFGMYYDKASAQKPFDAYVICFDENKEKLIRQPLYNPQKKYLDLMVLTTDADRSNWGSTDERYKGVDFLPWETALAIVEEGEIPPEIKKLCHTCDLNEDYSGFKAVSTQQDAEKLLNIAGGFHDARIVKVEERSDGSVYVLFDGAWGCVIELVFSGDVSYCLDGKASEGDPYWYGSSIAIKDGYIYLADDVIAVSEICQGDCWFKAKEMQYRIIPE